MTVTDFLVTEMTLYPWVAWLLMVFVVAGIAWWSVLLAHGVMFVSDWSAKKREAWRYKTWVMRELREHPDGADPPEYQHSDGDDELAEWEADTAADERWGQDMADLAEVLRVAHERGYLDDVDLRRCDNEDCGLVGVLHNGPCHDEGAWLDAHLRPDPEPPDLEPPDYRDGPAMPPQPVREYLPPAVMDDLAAAGFSRHETTDGAVDSMFTRAQARVVEAMITDGIIPIGEIGKGQDDGTSSQG